MVGFLLILRFCPGSGNGRNCAFLLGLYWYSELTLVTETKQHVKDDVPPLCWHVENSKSLLMLLGVSSHVKEPGPFVPVSNEKQSA